MFQQLTDSESLLSRNEEGINIILLRLEDWMEQVEKHNINSNNIALERLQSDVEKFATLLKEAIKRSSSTWLIGVCPPSEKITSNAEIIGFFRALKGIIASKISSLTNTYIVNLDNVASSYQVEKWNDSHTELIAHVPYTPEYFIALGTTLVRKIHMLRTAPYKVVVLDCDNTLWGGVCAEDGANNVRTDNGYNILQSFMKTQSKSGMLLCMVSKNEEGDVKEVFRCHPEMPLTLDDFVTWRINWNPKSSNLKEI